jgi:hypothetical protein
LTKNNYTSKKAIYNGVIMKTLTKYAGIYGLSASLAYAGIFGLNTWKDAQVYSEETDQVHLTVYLDGYDEIGVGIAYEDSDCLEFSSEIYDAPSINVNDVAVKMYAQCIGGSMRMDFPRTDKGRAYVISELKNEEKVVFEQDGYIFTFGTKNFENEVENVKVSEDGI